MNIKLRYMVFLVLLGLSMAPAIAFAGQGRISFSGRIVEATCGTSNTAITSIDTSPRHMTCEHAAGAAPSRGYGQSVTRIGGNPEDRVLSYFANYVRATSTGTTVPMLLTKVYD